MRMRLERIVLVLVVCVPVPLFALSGLTVPLPNVVERVAAALVPFANAAMLGSNEALVSGARGSIVLAPGGDREAPSVSPVKTTREVASREQVVPAVPTEDPPSRVPAAQPEQDVGGETTQPQSAPTDPPKEPDGDVPEAPAPSPTTPPEEPTSDPGEEPTVEPDGHPPVDPEAKPKDEPDPGPPVTPEVTHAEDPGVPPDVGSNVPPKEEPEVKPAEVPHAPPSHEARDADHAGGVDTHNGK